MKSSVLEAKLDLFFCTLEAAVIEAVVSAVLALSREPPSTEGVGKGRQCTLNLGSSLGMTR